MRAKREVVVSFAMMFVVGCVSGSPPPQPSGGGVGSGGGTGTGGSGSGTGSGSGSSGSGTGSGSGSGTGTGTGAGTGSGGGASAPMDGCAKYVMCLGSAMSAAAAMACDTNASMSATQLLGAVDQCAFGFCTGAAGGGTARCTTAADGSPTNPDGTPAFDMTGAPSGDCAGCLLNVEAGLFGQPCQPANDAACNATACAQAVSACQAS